MLNNLTRGLLDKPDALTEDGMCMVCGAHRATDAHHVIQKGSGGVPADLDARIPRVSLCRRCHLLAHSYRLHFAWSAEAGWYEFVTFREPTQYAEALERGAWRPLRKGRFGAPIGGRA
jgi:ribosomal protein L40E